MGEEDNERDKVRYSGRKRAENNHHAEVVVDMSLSARLVHSDCVPICICMGIIIHDVLPKAKPDFFALIPPLICPALAAGKGPKPLNTLTS